MIFIHLSISLDICFICPHNLGQILFRKKSIAISDGIVDKLKERKQIE